MKILNYIVNITPFTIMLFMGFMTFFNHTEWYKENAFTIACMLGYSFVFCLFSLYLSLIYIKKLFVEIPLLFLSLSSLTTCILGTENYYTSTPIFDFAYMSLMVVALIIIVYLKVIEYKMNTDNKRFRVILDHIYSRKFL